MYIRGIKSPKRNGRKSATNGVPGITHKKRTNNAQITGVIMTDSAFEEAVKRSGVNMRGKKTYSKRKVKSMRINHKTNINKMYLKDLMNLCNAIAETNGKASDKEILKKAGLYHEKNN